MSTEYTSPDTTGAAPPPASETGTGTASGSPETISGSTAAANLPGTGAPLTGTPTITMEQLQEKIKEYEAKVAQYEPTYNALQEHGGLEGAKPFLDLSNILSAQQFNAAELGQKLSSFDKERYAEFVWDSVGRYKEDITKWLAQDPQARQTILNSDPDFQAYQQAKARGVDFENLNSVGQEPLDPDDPQYQVKLQNQQLQKQLNDIQAQMRKATGETAQMRQQQAQEQMIERAIAYDDAQLNWLRTEIAKVDWGPDFKDVLEDTIQLAQSDFDKDPDAMEALKQARIFAAKGNNLLATRWTNVVRDKLAKKYQARVGRYNTLVGSHSKFVQSTRAQQGARVDIPGGSGAEPRLPGAGAQSQDARIDAVLQRMVASGQLPANFK